MFSIRELVHVFWVCLKDSISKMGSRDRWFATRLVPFWFVGTLLCWLLTLFVFLINGLETALLFLFIPYAFLFGIMCFLNFVELSEETRPARDLVEATRFEGLRRFETQLKKLLTDFNKGLEKGSVPIQQATALLAEIQKFGLALCSIDKAVERTNSLREGLGLAGFWIARDGLVMLTILLTPPRCRAYAFCMSTGESAYLIEKT